MKNWQVLRNMIVYSSLSLLITMAAYLFNMWLFSCNEYLRTRLLSGDALFIEGLVFALTGFLLLLGRGGINLWSLRAALLSAASEAVYDRDSPSSSEIFRRDRWRPQGFVRISSILILSGVFMILVYFLTLQ